MLIAIDTATDERTPGWEASKEGKYRCPACDSAPLVVRQGSVVIHHFAHPRGADGNCESEPESYEHANAKKALADLFGGDLEVPIGPTGHRRRADVLCGDAVLRRAFTVFPESETRLPAKPFGLAGAAFAVEIQCSPISKAEWWQRTIDHNRVGLPVLWIWGARHLTFNGETWSRTLGGYVQAWRASEAVRDCEVYWYRLHAGLAMVWLAGHPVIAALRYASTKKTRFVSLIDSPEYWAAPMFEVRDHKQLSLVVPYLNHLPTDAFTEQRDCHDRITDAYQAGRL